MSPIFSSLFFAGIASAQITTSIWLPAQYDSDEVGFVASVVGVNDGKTTLALAFDNDTSTYLLEDGIDETITYAGTTYLETIATTTAGYDDDYEDLTISMGCSMTDSPRARPTCTFSYGGKGFYDEYCSEYSAATETEDSAYTYTRVYTYTADEFGPASTVTYVRTYGDDDDDSHTYTPSYCKSGSTLPAYLAETTIVVPRDETSTYQVIITAGQEKLSATTGAAASATNSAKATGTAGGNGTNASGSPTGTSGGAPQNTGAAPLMTAAPMLAGVAAVAAVFL